MTDEKQASLRRERERAIALLSEAFAHDRIELDQFERQLSLAHRAADVSELERLVAGLPSTGSALVPVATAPLVARSQVRAQETMLALMGGAVRRGAWTPPQHLRVVAIMGGTELDFREARLAPGVTDVSIFALMGGVHIIVPPTLAVEVHGTGIMGGLEHLARQPPESEPESAFLRVRGIALMGGVSIETRLPGEGHHDARRRRRRERKERRRALRRLP